MADRVAVAGGTGVLGRCVVDVLRRRGAEPVVLARSTGTDLLDAAGIGDALDGVRAVVDVTDPGSLRRDVAMRFFSTVTANLLAAGARAGVAHHVAVSIVGVDRVPTGYYAAKLAQEQRVLAAAVPTSVLRTTQFHEFVPRVLDSARGPVAPVPVMRVQPVAAREVAEALVALALDPAVGRAPELAGPEVHDLTRLARRLLRARGQRRVVLPLRAPVASSRAVAGGALLPSGPGPRGRQGFDAWLREAVS